MFKVSPKTASNIQYVEYGKPENPEKVIFLHGYGADMMDLYPLAQVIDPQAKYHWVFANGILDVPIGPHMYGKGWFNIDIPSFERSLRMGEFSKLKPTGMDTARDKLKKFIETVTTDAKNFYLGGFSQGAMLVTELLLETDLQPKGAILLSTTLVNEDSWTAQMPERKGLRYYQSHGVQDPILPVELAQRFHDRAEENGWDGFLQLFQGGHEIPNKVIADVVSFLR